MDSTVILIGPISAGKSTVGKLLAEKLRLPHYQLDEDRWTYYNEIGYDQARVSEIARHGEGMLGVLRYWKPFEAHAVERILQEHSGSVIDFGAGHSVYEEKDLFDRVERALAPYPNVVLLLPSPDLDESVAILNARFLKMLEEEGQQVDRVILQVNEHFTKHPSNHRLAKMVVYTKGQTPQETRDEIVRRMQWMDDDTTPV